MVALLPNVVVAGGGVVGTSIAYYLGRIYNQPVTIIDPVGIAPAASGKAGGLLNKDWRDGTPLQQMQRLGFDLHQEIANGLQDSITTTTDYRRMNCVAVAVDENPDTSVQKPRSKKLKDVEWVDYDVVMDTVPMGDESTIAQVHPRKFCEAIWNWTETNVGSTLMKGRIVRAILEESDNGEYNIQAVELDNGNIIPTETLVIACGPWTYEANKWFQGYDNIPMDPIPDITGVKCHSILVKSPKVLSQAVFFESDGVLGDGDLEVYPRLDGDCYINGFPDDETTVTERPGEESLDPKALDLLQEAMSQTASKELFQGQATTTPHTQQVCYWPETPDGLPLLGPIPGIKGAFVATGHSVWGILQGPASGKAMAELIVEGESKCLDLSEFILDRFTIP